MILSIISIKQLLEYFDQYILKHSSIIKEIKPSFLASQALKSMTQPGNQSVIDPIFIDQINQLYQTWIKNTEYVFNYK